jgi:hypothetical protein
LRGFLLNRLFADLEEARRTDRVLAIDHGAGLASATPEKAAGPAIDRANYLYIKIMATRR